MPNIEIPCEIGSDVYVIFEECESCSYWSAFDKECLIDRNPTSGYRCIYGIKIEQFDYSMIPYIGDIVFLNSEDAVKMARHRKSHLNSSDGPNKNYWFLNVDEEKLIKKKRRSPNLSKSQLEYREYLKTDHWQELSKRIIDERKKCELCGKEKFLNVHHKTYENRGHELDEDLQVLCKMCHKKEHNKI